LYYYANPYYVSPYDFPLGTRTVPYHYFPAYIQTPIQPWYPCQPQRQYPDVNTQQLEESAHKFQQLIQQADLLIDKLAESKEFAYELMSAAQKSDEKKVHELIKSTGITIKIKTSFTPTGIRIILANSKVEGDCCDLLIALRW